MIFGDVCIDFTKSTSKSSISKEKLSLLTVQSKGGHFW